MQKNLKMLSVIAILGASLAISGFAIQDAMAAGANKSIYSTAAPAVLIVGDGTGTLAETSMKSSNPQDVLILYNEECSLYTELNLKGKNTDADGVSIDEAHVSHTVQLFVDDEPVGGPITMCDRTFGIETNVLSIVDEICETVSGIPGGEDLECEETFLNTWINTKSAHGWNWVVVDLGDFGTDMYHDFRVEGSVIDEQGETNTKNPDTKGVVIGERSLIVIPTQLNN
jgi:hypothetical protein